MSLSTKPNQHPNTFTYTPALFGHPHEVLPPQLIEPFYAQYPEWVDPARSGEHTSYYNRTIRYPLDTITMDSETPVYIGSNTENGRIKKSPSPKQSPKKEASGRLGGGRGFVDVYANGTFLKRMPLGILCRFSRVASTAFPRPDRAATGGVVNGGDNGIANGSANGTGDANEVVNDTTSKAEPSEKQDKKKSIDWAEDDSQVQKLSNGIAKLNIDTAPSANGTTQPHNRSINFYLDTLWFQPPVSAYEFAFAWMHTAKDTEKGQFPIPYGVPSPEKLSLEMLVDLYAVALALELRPVCHDHRRQVLEKITNMPPTRDALVYLHEHLPIGDTCITRFITNYFQYRDLSATAHMDAEIQAIEDYVCAVDFDLHTRFKEIGEARLKARREKEKQRMQKIAEGYQNGNMQANGITFVGAGYVGQMGNGNGVGHGGKQQNGHKVRGTGTGWNGNKLRGGAKAYFYGGVKKGSEGQVAGQ